MVSESLPKRIIRTRNIAHTLAETARTLSVDVKSLDFDLVDTITLKKHQLAATWEEWDQPLTEAMISDPEMGISQEYNIVIELRKARNVAGVLRANGTKTKAVIDLEYRFGNYQEGCLKLLRNEIDRIRAREGMIIGLGDAKMLPYLKKLCDKMRVNDALSGKVRIPICELPEGAPSHPDELIVHYKKAYNPESIERVDYSERDEIVGTEKDALLIEYRKVSQGKPWRDYRGVFHQSESIEPTELPKFEIDPETIRVVENGESLSYFAKVSGVVVDDGKELFIGDTVELDTIDFKSTGNIHLGRESGVRLEVKGNDPLEDRVGVGMKVDATEIDVNGSIRKGAELTADLIVIRGRTHHENLLRGNRVEVNFLKGRIESKEAYVTTLEMGEVIAEDVKVENAQGGRIVGKRVRLGAVRSHVEVTATDYIEIMSVQGSENRFVFEFNCEVYCPPSLKGLMAQKELQRGEEDELERQIETLKQTLLHDKGRLVQIKQELDRYRDEGREPPEVLIKNFSEIQFKRKKLAEYEEMLEEIGMTDKLLKAELARYEEMLMNATLRNKGAWEGNNVIIYRLIDPPRELVFRPKAGLGSGTAYLEEDDDGEFFIHYRRD